VQNALSTGILVMHARAGLSNCTRLARPALLALALLATTAAADTRPSSRSSDRPVTVYKWVDENGTVHYGDVVPPQYADQDKTVLNGRGMEVGKIEGKRTPEQMAAEAEKKALEAKAQSELQHERDRDRHLLATYGSIEEIELLRDRRVEIIDVQSQVTQQLIDQLKAHESQLVAQAEHFRPYNPKAATLMPDRLAEELVRLENDLRAQLRNLAVKQKEAADLKAQFASDIARYKELSAKDDVARVTPARN
jgi:Domain of unknown function (DUF4124)